MSVSAAENAVAHLYHSWITGQVLTLVSRAGADQAEAFVFRLFRTQHHEKFLPGLTKLGLDHLPHAVAAARYHYFSNQLGGVRVEYLEVGERKAWVRYPPPRWIWQGSAICGIPSNVNRAMLHGWHAHNGVTLNNPRLGFVCTKTTADGQPGLEGYYREFDHPLTEDERLQFRPQENCPRIDPASLPELDSDRWPEERRAKAYRNYAMEYLRNGLPILVSQFGPEQALYLGRLCALQIGMHCYQEIARLMQVPDDGAESFVALMQALLSASGDTVTRSGLDLHQSQWRIFHNDSIHPVVRQIWLSVYEGLLQAHNRFLNLTTDGQRITVQSTTFNSR